MVHPYLLLVSGPTREGTELEESPQIRRTCPQVRMMMGMPKTKMAAKVSSRSNMRMFPMSNYPSAPWKRQGILPILMGTSLEMMGP